MNAPVTFPQEAAPALDEVTLNAAHAACARIAPLWPLDAFVAVNPFLGLADHDLAGAAGRMARAAGARLTLPREAYLARIDAGEITRNDLERALAAAGLRMSPEALTEQLQSPAPVTGAAPTVADVVSSVTGTDWAGFVTDRVSIWAAGFLDAGQAAWPDPARNMPAFDHWRNAALCDATCESRGLKGFRAALARLPDEPGAVFAQAVERLGIAPAQAELFFHRQLMTVSGWAGIARKRLWDTELAGGTDDTLRDLLAIRLCHDLVLWELFGGNAGVKQGWAEALVTTADPDFTLDAVLQDAAERAWQRQLAGTLSAPPAAPAEGRATLQAAFCIDVRSEVFRRALEASVPGAQTLGFAGFFGLPIAHTPMGEAGATAQCPVLLSPGLETTETLANGDAAASAQTALSHAVGRVFGGVAKRFKAGGASCFGFVEAAGLGYLGAMIRDSLALPDTRDAAARRPVLAGLDATARADTAAAVLNAMSLTKGFARVVLLCGHGGSTRNNPHARGLDCGACGGQAGSVNARVLADLLNAPDVRHGLAERGIDVPGDTVFVAGLHDTTTDGVALFDLGALPKSHEKDIRQLEAWLSAAGKITRAERATKLPLPPGLSPAQAMAERARHWAETRPEWALAGCSAFIAAPRTRTAGKPLDGAVFLHDYDWQADDGFKTLELILTAPVVVASWISLQYYGSTVDNRVFGSGNKVLHNVVGGIGVLEGNGGDLRVGLPLQSVHDGEGFIHPPRRLTVAVEAPQDAIAGIVAAHDGLRDLVGNGWISLFAMDDAGQLAWRHDGKGGWVQEGPQSLSKAA